MTLLKNKIVYVVRMFHETMEPSLFEIVLASSLQNAVTAFTERYYEKDIRSIEFDGEFFAYITTAADHKFSVSGPISHIEGQ